MFNIVRVNGEIYSPPRECRGSGRPGKYPFAHLEVGDHFVAPWRARPSIIALLSQARKFGREHQLGSGDEPNTITITRIK